MGLLFSLFDEEKQWIRHNMLVHWCISKELKYCGWSACGCKHKERKSKLYPSIHHNDGDTKVLYVP